MPPDVDWSVIVVTGGSGLSPSLQTVKTAMRAGAMPVVDVGRGGRSTVRELNLIATEVAAPVGVRVTGLATEFTPDDLAPGATSFVLLTADAPWTVAELATRHRVFVEVTDLAEALEARQAGAHGLVARGMESGGRVSELSAFVLFQTLVDHPDLDMPVWVAGGIGPRTAAASRVAGAAGVVLDSQLMLFPEAVLPDEIAPVVRRMDGSECRRDGQRTGLPYGDELVPIGADGWLAAEFARRWPDTAAAVLGIREAIREAADDAGTAEILRPGSPLARSLGVSLPVAQGPMTRVSDVPEFAAAVAAEGALPFVALGVAGPDQARRLLRDTARELGDRPWGVGVLGFAAEDLRAAQMEVIREVRPSCVVIAGGRPAQAAEFERDGIRAYLHVPSPALLRQFLQAGSRRFVFEGAECGGHVGPRSSFSLWEAQIGVIERFLNEAGSGDAEQLEIFFAGGVHDERSAALVAALAGPLNRRGVRIGVLMGTAYLFTAEAVESGAITPVFQQQVVAATRTALLETAPGHATRCLETGFVQDFRAVRDELEAADIDRRTVWGQLELLNTGRSRIAGKGVRRNGDQLVEVPPDEQLEDGLFMAGQVAVLRSAVTSIRDLHTRVTTGGADLLQRSRTVLCRELGLGSAPQPPAADPLDIAIIGMACVFPGAPDLNSYWSNVVGGTDSISEVPAERWDQDVYYSAAMTPDQVGRVSVANSGGFLDPVPFDAIGFGVPPNALASIDPTQLLALEVSRRALVDAGYHHDAPGADHARTGVVFAAQPGTDMGGGTAMRLMLPAYHGEVPPEFDEVLPRITEDSFPGILANVIAGRVANRLDLGGPNFTLDAACASSLAAVDAACKELAGGTSDLMLCGAADLHNGIADFVMFSSVRALSPSGRPRTFDDAADGTAIGEGIACLVLKRLDDAHRDGDRVYSVIKGVGAASDGRALGLTAPRPAGQRRALQRAYASAGLTADRVGLLEAHGTGTTVGDRTELATLTEFFAEAGANPGGVALGSVKSQIGHTKCAAGLAGMIKATLAVYTGVRPPTINLSRPNRGWDEATSPFSFRTEAAPWPTPGPERVAGVSAFGFGGTNFHVVLTGDDRSGEPRHARAEWPEELFLFRGTDREGAHRVVRKLLERLPTTTAGTPLRDLAAEIALDGGRGPVHVAVVARDLADLTTLLGRALTGEHDPRTGLIQPGADAPNGKVAFLFPGQGSQQPGSLADLFVAFPELHRHLRLGSEYVDLAFPPTTFDEATTERQRADLRDTRSAQPVLGMLGMAAFDLLRRFGIEPDMAAGHSYGELVSLCAAGVFDESTLLALSRRRADAILSAVGADPGAMAAVSGSADQVRAVLDQHGLTDEVVPANHNAPSQVVVSGPTAAVGRAVTALGAAGLSVRPLEVACAFHSPLLSGAVPAFATELSDVDFAEAAIPVWSNRNADRYPSSPHEIRAELAEQVGAPVRFVEQIESMYAAGARVFVEAGPGRVLSGLVAAILGERPHEVVPIDGAPGRGIRALLTAVGRLACAGTPVQTAWMYQGRVSHRATPSPRRPVWMVDGGGVRDSNGNRVPGSMVPPGRVKEFSMAVTPPKPAAEGLDRVMTEYLRTNQQFLEGQRQVMLALLGDSAAAASQPAPVLLAAAPEPLSPRPLAPALPSPQPPAPPVLEVAPPAPVSAKTSDAELSEMVLSLISERTGYPVEMVEPDLDLEADLSVDSIKRAEIAGEVSERLGLALDGDGTDLEELVKARTVRAMVAWLGARLNTAPETAPAPRPGSGVAPERLRPRWRPADAEGDDHLSLAGTRFAVSGPDAMATHTTQMLTAAGATVGDLAGADGWVLLDALTDTGEALLPSRYADLRAFLSRAPRRLIAVAREADDARADGAAGLFATIALEYPDILVRLILVPETAGTAEVSDAVRAELALPEPAPVVRRTGGERWLTELTPQPLGALARRGGGPAGDGAAEIAAMGLTSESVVVLVGGARGVTVSVARALAAAGRCRIELAGRTELPDRPEDPRIAEAADLPALRRVLLAQGLPAAQVERAARRIMASREVVRTLAELTALGSRVRYHTVDAVDGEAMTAFLKDVHEEHGRLDGVVYAAGVIDDKLIADKDADSFTRVFRTKVDGAMSVLRGLDGLGIAPGFVVLFGSIAAFGSRGQADYAAANDALAAMGSRWAADSGNRCLTVHWGPWEPSPTNSGMVTEHLAERYRLRGVEMIDLSEGAMSLLRELAWGDPADTAVLCSGSGW